jgi:predicted dienelactone hydrolase
MPGEAGACGALTRRSLLAVAGLAALPARAAVQDFSWTDAARGRTLPLRVRWPEGAGPWPVLLFSHGLGGSRDGGEAWGRTWCDAGFVVIHLQHPGSDSAVWVQGLSALRAAANPTQLLNRVADVHFVIDELQRRQAAGDSEWRHVRPQALGVAGHSFGAQTVAALAGRRYPVEAPGLVDPRPRAFIAFSPSVGQGPLTPAQQYGGVHRPFMVLTGSLDGDPFGSYATGEPRWQVYDALPPGAKAGLWLDGADHMSFGGQARALREAGPLGARDARAVAGGPAHRALIASLTTLWWRSWLLDDAQARAALRAPPGLGPADRWRLSLG